MKVENEPLAKGGYTRLTPLAKILTVHPQTIRRWWNTGKFPEPKRLHGMLLFANDEVLAWLDENAKGVFESPYTYNNPNISQLGKQRKNKGDK